MKVAVTGATGVVGTSTVRALVAAGLEVVGVARTGQKAALLDTLGAEPRQASVFDGTALREVFAGCDVVCNTATHVPVGVGAVMPVSWREHDRLRSEGVAVLTDAAARAGVRRVVHASVSFIYADAGDEWIDETGSLDITQATEPVAEGESRVQAFASGSRRGVVLRLGRVVGEDPATQYLLRAAAAGRAIGVGDPGGWTHVVHPDDVGTAMVAALQAGSGIYNVGAKPIRRRELVDAVNAVAGGRGGGFMGPLVRRVTGARFEPYARSLRVSSDRFIGETGWRPEHPAFDAGWLAGARASTVPGRGTGGGR